MTQETPPTREGDITFERLEDQIAWYDSKSIRNQRAFKRTKITVLIAAALVPFLAASTIPHISWITGALGVLIVILEGLLQLNQSQPNWISYRSTCESLKHEKYVFLGNAPPYAGVADAHALLAERIEALVSQEHAKWVLSQQVSKDPQK